ncbi:MAG: PKD domain-containing protein [Candidatus Bipolaricaulia bacterium]
MKGLRGMVAGAIIALCIWGLMSGQAQQPSPLIGVEQQLSPKEIYFRSAGEPDRAVVTLTLRALRGQPFPLDLVLVVDRSASSDIIAVRKIGKEILSRLGREDRVALVSFADKASLEVELTFDEARVAARLDQLQNMGKTGLGEGLAEANRELLERGRADAVLVEILLADGSSNTGRAPLPQAEIAARNGIVIHAIGIGRYLDPNLAQIASMTGGLFFPKYDGEVVGKIFAALYRDLVGTGLLITRTLAAGFTYERALQNPPSRITSGNGLTTLEWSLEELAVGASWTASFEVSYAPAVEGRNLLEVDSAPGSVSFTDFRHRRQELELPVLTVTVRGPNRKPSVEFTFTPKEPTDLDMISFEDRSSDPDGEIVAWIWDFGDGTSSSEQNPQHRYADNGVYLVKLTVQDNEGAEESKEQEIRVRNVDPLPSFTYSPERICAGQKVAFDASGSVDPDGEIVRYEWDLDGDLIFEAEGKLVERAYDRAGTYRVTLRVTDNDGASATVVREVSVLKAAVATREINTYLHVDKTLPGETFRVTVKIEINMDLNGLGLDEDLPEGWTVTPVENAEATYHEKAVQWLFVGKIPAGTTKTVIYDVTVPANAALKIYNLTGKINSASPAFELAVEGEGQVEIVDRLPISWVVSRWDTENDRFNIQLGDKISFEQVQQAVAWWLEGKIVEHTGGAVINLQTILELVAYWLTDTPVYEPLP